MRKVRVRFAPSPTGPLHIGGLRTALYNYLLARQSRGTMILRIEDTDQNRYVPGAEEYIINALEWAGIRIDEGPGVGGPFSPYRQSQRKSIYAQYARQLVDSGYAYYAFDSEQEVEKMRERLKSEGSDHQQYSSTTRLQMLNSLTLGENEVKELLISNTPRVIRFKVPQDQEVSVKDLIRGTVTVHSSELDDKVLMKSDGTPTYHLANVVDDYLMKITHVIRGEEWLPSAPLHVLLYKYFGWENVMPQFVHLPLLLKPDGHGKLSKRDGDQLGFPVFPLEWTDPATNEVSSGYRESGYFPDAVINILALLGWHPTQAQEIFTLDELVHEFSLEHVAKGGAKFDPEKAKWLNQQYLRSKSDDTVAEVFQKQLSDKQKIYGFKMPDSEYLKKVCNLLKEKASFINEFWSLGKYFFIAPDKYDTDIVRRKWNEKNAGFFSALKAKYLDQTSFTHEMREKTFKQEATGLGIKPGEVMQLFRVIITGVAGGPALFEVVALLGKDEVMKRIERALTEFKF